MTELVVAVRDLVAFCHRSGDIDHRFTPSPSAAEGIAGHQRVQARRPATYQREFALSYLHCEGDLRLTLRGRADGYDPQQRLLEEIKTCRVAVADIPESVTAQHMAQALVYAAMACAAGELPGLEVRLTWYHVDSGEESSSGRWYEAAELAALLARTLAHFSDWLARLSALRQRRDDSLEQLAFPHGEFRPGQRDIAELVYKCVDQGGQLLVEAPTGIGKTAAVLYPALRGLGRGKHDAVAFTTARTVGRFAAEQCLDLMATQGLVLPRLTLTAKERICFSPGRACHGDDCPFARGYYDRLPAALREALAAPSLYRSDIERIARAHEVCPYQLADDLLPWVDLVICDLHYLFSLQPRLGGDDRRLSVLVDEAHNLPERARSMYSARLSKRRLMSARRDAPAPLKKALDRANRVLLALQRETWPDAGDGELPRDSRRELPDGLQFALADFVAATGESLARAPGFLQRQPALLDFFFDALHWLRVADAWGDEYRLELSRGRGPQGLELVLNCLDPSRLLAVRHQRLHALVAFSATLSPGPWMRALLGLDAGAVWRRLESPFEPAQLAVTLATGVDTRFRAREQSLGALAALLQRWLAQQPGNCLLYFPSYRYLADCLNRLDIAGRTLWQQQPELEDHEREELLALLRTRRDVAAFCILGGVFGEGIDLPGEQLQSVVVVGVGLPQVGHEREQLRDWYQQRYGQGFEYAYLYPGMQKVDQALGRVVRTASDSGSALLVDSRYGWRQYRELLPPWWHYQQAVPGASESGSGYSRDE